ncbi:hypothetical protein MLD38_026270 [Melastoma candidum]|uniref:Uncharacterized protein n=1 Tax=Melastoma candidum TaxID=119954 RepID=A0ACB9NYH9_9MYRT|nr:hypothetical protein MLD38_026270 [Melastoma candidum]
MVRLHPGFMHYLFYVLCLFASITVVESLMMAIASVVPNFLMGIIIGAGIQGIFMLVSGYFRLPNDIPKPVWRYPMTYIASFTGLSRGNTRTTSRVWCSTTSCKTSQGSLESMCSRTFSRSIPADPSGQTLASCS